MIRIYTGPEALIYVKKELQGAENVSVFSSEVEAVDALSHYDPFSARRFILLNMDTLKISDRLYAAAESVRSDAATCLLIQAGTIDRTDKGYMKLKAGIHECSKFTEKQLYTMLNRKINISEAALTQLIERSGYYTDGFVNIYTLFTLLEQVALLGGITEENISRVLPETPAKKAYLLAQMLCSGRTDLAITESRKLFSENSSEISLLSMLRNTFKYTWREKKFGAGCTGLEDYRFAFATGFSEQQLRHVCKTISSYITSCKNGCDSSICYWLCLSEIHSILSA